MGAVLSTMLLIGAMQNCASGYDEDKDIITFTCEGTLENNGYEYIIDKGGNYTITYNSQTHNLIFTIHNNVLKNYELYRYYLNIIMKKIISQ